MHGREGDLRELNPIAPGHIVQDNNLLACSHEHFDAVCKMLNGQRDIQLAGGLEAGRLTDWHIARLRRLRIGQMFLAYDREGQYEAVKSAILRLRCAGFTQRQVRCFVLVGFSDDTPEAALRRLDDVFQMGALPFAMLYRGDDGKLKADAIWHGLVREWSRPAIMMSRQQKVEGIVATELYF